MSKQIGTGEYINMAFVEHISKIDKHNNIAKSKKLSFSTRLIKESFGAYKGVP